MFTAEEIFLRDIKTLRNAVNNPNVDSLMDAVVAVRRLLLDGSPLLHQVNRSYQVDIQFRVREQVPMPPEVASILAEAVFHIDKSFSPDIPCNGSIVKVGRDKFLKVGCVPLKGGSELTIRDLIVYLAHTAGAVHKDVAKEDKQKSLERGMEEFNELGIVVFGRYPRDFVLETFHLVAKIILEALEPLNQKIQNPQPVN